MGILALLIAFVCAPASPRAAQDAALPALKAAFLLNFAKFAEWPREADGQPLTLCVLGDQASEEALAQLAARTSINGHSVLVSRAASGSMDHLRDCHLLYVGETDGNASAQPALLAELRGLPILTVGDGEPFARHSGIVGLLVEGNRMRFAINADAAKRAGVRLSSKLLMLAVIVHE